jgi:arylsulfatase A-like enzyme
MNGLFSSDVAPTFADLSGVPVPDKVDGMSLVGLVDDSKSASWPLEELHALEVK